jgi:hypothetical protein
VKRANSLGRVKKLVCILEAINGGAEGRLIQQARTLQKNSLIVANQIKEWFNLLAAMQEVLYEARNRDLRHIHHAG